MDVQIDDSKGQDIKPKSKHSNSPKIGETDVRKTELCYITSVNRSTRTFFAQLCKITNEELIQFNHSINDHCSKLTADKQSTPTKVHKGDVLCARYPKDGVWYRALIVSRDNERQNCFSLFVDYGNLETIGYKDLLRVDPKGLAIMERAPFGISCFLEGSENFKQEESEHLLDCLAQNYVMIKVLERQTKLQWKVNIPKHAYNIPFWLIFKPELRAGIGRANGGVSEKLDGQALDSPQEVQAASTGT